MYITTSYNLCSISIRSTKKFKLVPLLCTHIYSYMLLWKVHSLGFIVDFLIQHKGNTSLEFGEHKK